MEAQWFEGAACLLPDGLAPMIVPQRPASTKLADRPSQAVLVAGIESVDLGE
jgi:hypothetical protein